MTSGGRLGVRGALGIAVAVSEASGGATPPPATPTAVGNVFGSAGSGGGDGTSSINGARSTLATLTTPIVGVLSRLGGRAQLLREALSHHRSGARAVRVDDEDEADRRGEHLQTDRAHVDVGGGGNTSAQLSGDRLIVEGVDRA